MKKLLNNYLFRELDLATTLVTGLVDDKDETGTVNVDMLPPVTELRDMIGSLDRSKSLMLIVFPTVTEILEEVPPPPGTESFFNLEAKVLIG